MFKCVSFTFTVVGILYEYDLRLVTRTYIYEYVIRAVYARRYEYKLEVNIRVLHTFTHYALRVTSVCCWCGAGCCVSV